MKRIAGVILYFRAGPESLAEVVDACLKQTRAFDELLVVDNASGDGVCQSNARRFPGLVLATCEQNRGYADGMNHGFNALSQAPDFCFFITHDVVMQDDCVESLVKRLEAGAVLVGPKLRLPNGQVWSQGGEIDCRGKPSHAQKEPISLSWLDGAVLGVDAPTFTSVGGFDKRFFLYWEDVDLGFRMNQRGRIECVSSTEATQRTNLTPPYLMARGRILMWRLHRKPHLLVASLLELIGASLVHLLTRRNQAARQELWLVLQGCVSGITGTMKVKSATCRPHSMSKEPREH